MHCTICDYSFGSPSSPLGKLGYDINIRTVYGLRTIGRSRDSAKRLFHMMHGKTQNANESFNSVLWARLPKNIFIGRKVLELGAYDSLLTYNDGEFSKLKVFKKMGLQIGKNMVLGLSKIDEQRISKAEFKCQKKVSRKRTHATRVDDSYGAGNF